MTYGPLFTGIGGLDLGLDRAGFECKWQVEIDPYAVKVLEKHWPGVKRYGDITKLDGSELEPVDLMCGGFPCQDLSQAGKQVGITGSRSGLWFEFARIIGVVRPRYVLIENVPGLLVYDAMRRVIGELARLRYVGIWRSLRASEFGASHLRASGHQVDIQDAVSVWEPSLPAHQIPDGPTSSENVQTSHRHWKTPHGMSNRDAKGKIGGCGGGEFANQANHWEATPQPKRLNPRFVEWLMGFPIQWTEIP